MKEKTILCSKKKTG